MTLSVGILGGSGYTGAELLRLLSGHPSLAPTIVTADSCAGERVATVYPHLRHYGELTYLSHTQAHESLEWCDVIFSALPHGEGMKILSQLKNRIVVDLSGDFRLRDAKLYETWYGNEHSSPADLSRWVYGIPEFFRSEIQKGTRIANPGCYATAIIFALAPLVKNHFIQSSPVINAMSGTSGAGRPPKPNLHFSHVFEDVRAYKVATHQHTPEIEQALLTLGGEPITISFTPHLLPAVRGIYVTASCELKEGVSKENITAVFEEMYRGEPFVHVTQEPCGTKEVRGSNCVELTPTVDLRTGRVIINAAIDNLVKGAAGQAIQNANLALGFDETTGLSDIGVYP